MAYDILRCRADQTRSFKRTITSSDGAMTIGTLYKINDTWGIAFASEDNSAGAEGVGDSVAVGKEITIIYKAEKCIVAKESDSANSIAVGDHVYVHTTNKNVNKTDSGANHEWVGTCTKAAAATDTTVEIELNGTDSGRA